MKDTPLPPLPEDAAPPRSVTLPRPSPSTRPLQTSTTSRMPQSRSQRAPQPSATMSPPPQPQPRQPNIFRRITSKLRSSNASRQPPVPRPTRDNAVARDAPQRKSTMLRMPPMPKAPVPAAQVNDFTSLEQRQAALRARGLLPATGAVPRQFRGGDGFMLPLSEQEAEIDRRFTIVVPGDSSTEDEGAASEAKRIRKAWLSKQAEASTPSLSEVDKDEDEDRVEAVAAAAADPSPPRKSDAAERASKDGTIGERSPVRATFVAIDAPPLSPSAAEFGAGARVASPFEGTEDFHTAPNSPTFPEDRQPLSIEQDGRLRAPSPSSPSRANRPLLTLSSAVYDAPPLSPTKDEHSSPSNSPSAHSAEKVSRWLRDSSDMSTPVPHSETAASAITSSDHEPVLSASPRESLEAPLPPSAGTMRSRREKPPPIVITQPGKAPSHANAAPSDSETSTSSMSSPGTQRGRRSLSGSGSGSGTARRPAHAPSIQSRMTTGTTGTLPALSPTRTVSSVGAESSSLPTPTTTSCGAPALARDASLSRGSTSNSSDNGHDVVTRPRRGTGPGLLGTTSKVKVPGSGAAAAAIPEEFSETEPSSEGGEFGMNVTPVPVSTRPRASQEGVAVPRPSRSQTLDQASEKAQNRKSFSLFGKKSLEMPRETRTASSMMNLRRAFTSSKPRPKSTTLEVLPETMGRKRSKNFDASHLPPSPTVPTAPTSLAPSSFRGTGRPSNGGLRPPPRQAVAPTMHSHGTIVHQTNFIEDDESRRLSEMAFLT
ncbi:hypothetical protein GSI_02096 [Ganoderma sinense ZZ0214-1]|uniref:Uncharacterized protein n=1 Tax=Ganoderma sinense ZZ0214-1 TaxID=1077348 RepID=A0A2G8SNP0_9APHY|nr:hypothetical protein GSI_02096 [Ganoderma sinense ZZ0214-1]